MYGQFVTLGPGLLDDAHTYVRCDGCLILGVRLEPVTLTDMTTGEPIGPLGGELTGDEARAMLADHGWLLRVESFFGGRIYLRDFCPSCRRHVIA